MLLIIFYGEFCSFHRPIMSCLESQLNHGEFKSKSKLQIKIGVSEAVQKKKATLEISQGLCCEFSQPLQIFQGCKFSQPTNLAILDFSLYYFLSFQICPYVIAIIF